MKIPRGERYRWMREDSQTRETLASCIETRFRSPHDTKICGMRPIHHKFRHGRRKNILQSLKPTSGGKKPSKIREFTFASKKNKDSLVLSTFEPEKWSRVWSRMVEDGRGWSREVEDGRGNSPKPSKKTRFGDVEGTFGLFWCNSEFLTFSGQIVRQMEIF